MKNINRRDFVKGALAVSGAAAVGVYGGEAPLKGRENDLIWANLLHLSYNMWEDRPEPKREERYYRPYLRFDEDVWNDLLHKMAENGLNMVVLDLGDGVQYKSRPEIAVENAWSVDKLKSELKKIRDLGLMPIPKMNFSTAHDAWLGEYAKCVSTRGYYDVCRDLLNEVIEIFEQPPFFHLGLDEETARHQRYYSISIVRQFDLWWHDFYFYRDILKEHGVRAWIWSDYIWRHQETFLEKMPKDVVQSHWYYGIKFDAEKEDNRKMATAYKVLAANGYDQIPTGSNWSHPENFGMTVDYAVKNIPSGLLGFLQTPWKPTLKQFLRHHLQAIELVGKAKTRYDNKR